MARCPAGHESQTSDYCDTCGAVMGGAPLTPAPLLESTALLAGGAGARGPEPGDACPHCGAQRDGRFCEECGFDYEMAELLPSVPAGRIAEPVAGPDLNGHAPGVVAPAAGAVGEPPAAQPDGGLAQQPGRPEGLSRATQEPATEAAEENPAEPVGEQVAENLAYDPAYDSARFPDEAAPAPVAPRPLALVVTADHEYYTAQVERGDIIESEFPFPKYPGERRFALDAEVVRIGRASASRGLVVEIDLTGPPLDPAVSHLHAQLLRGRDGDWRLVDLGSANGTRLNGAEQPVPVETEVPVKAGDRIHVGVWTTLTLEEA